MYSKKGMLGTLGIVTGSQIKRRPFWKPLPWGALGTPFGTFESLRNPQASFPLSPQTDTAGSHSIPDWRDEYQSSLGRLGGFPDPIAIESQDDRNAMMASPSGCFTMPSTTCQQTSVSSTISVAGISSDHLRDHQLGR